MIKARANDRISAKAYIPSDEQTHLHARTRPRSRARPQGTVSRSPPPWARFAKVEEEVRPIALDWRPRLAYIVLDSYIYHHADIDMSGIFAHMILRKWIWHIYANLHI